MLQMNRRLHVANQCADTYCCPPGDVGQFPDTQSQSWLMSHSLLLMLIISRRLRKLFNPGASSRVHQTALKLFNQNGSTRPIRTQSCLHVSVEKNFNDAAHISYNVPRIRPKFEKIHRRISKITFI